MLSFFFFLVRFNIFIVVTVLTPFCKYVRYKRSCVVLNPALFLPMPFHYLYGSIFNFADVPEEAPSGEETLNILCRLSASSLHTTFIKKIFFLKDSEGG